MRLIGARSNSNCACSRRETFGHSWRIDDLLAVLERRRLSIGLSVALANALHDGDGRVFRWSAFFATVWKTVDGVIGVAAVEERNRVALFAALVDHPVEVTDITVVRPVRVSNCSSTNDSFAPRGYSPPCHHVTKVNNVGPCDRGNVKPLLRALLPDL
jgi:hypothetical protein